MIVDTYVASRPKNYGGTLSVVATVTGATATHAYLFDAYTQTLVERRSPVSSVFTFSNLAEGMYQLVVFSNGVHPQSRLVLAS